MTDTLARLEARLADVERALTHMDRRLHAVESGARAGAGSGPAAGRPLVAARPGATDADGTLTIVGQTFVIFAGAYLLRALTESATTGRVGGVALGLAYAVVWSIVADRVAARASLRATFYGGCTVLLGLSLLWEATTRFHLMPASLSASALTLLTGIVLAVAWRQRLHALAWLATAGAIVAGAALLVTTGDALAFTAFFIALGIAALWLGYEREWVVLRWPTAFVADGAVFGLTERALTTPPRDAPAIVVAIQLLLLTAYLASIAVRTLARGRNVLPFEVVQTGAVLLVGLNGAMVVAHRAGNGAALTLGYALVAMAALSYAVAFAFVDRRQGRGANLYFYTSLALVFALAGSSLVLPVPLLSVAWAALAVSSAATARRYRRMTLAVHAVIYAVAAALASGLMSASFAGLYASPSVAWPALGVAGWVVLGASVACVALLRPARRLDPAFTPAMPRRVVVAVTAIGLAGACTILLAPVLLAASPAASPAGTVATLRTLVIAAAVVTIAWLGRREGTRECGYLLYPVLAWGALKLVTEDFPASPPSLLFIALASYGGALILAPRIARARAKSERSPADATIEPSLATTGPSGTRSPRGQDRSPDST